MVWVLMVWVLRVRFLRVRFLRVRFLTVIVMTVIVMTVIVMTVIVMTVIVMTDIVMTVTVTVTVTVTIVTVTIAARDDGAYLVQRSDQKSLQGRAKGLDMDELTLRHRSKGEAPASVAGLDTTSIRRAIPPYPPDLESGVGPISPGQNPLALWADRRNMADRARCFRRIGLDQFVARPVSR